MVIENSLFFALVVGFSSGLAYATEPESETKLDEELDLDSWLDDDSETHSIDVNEGKLTFIQPVTGKNTLHTDIELTIDKRSLETGWVKLRQCYNDINPVDTTDIVYQYRQINNLLITSTSGIGSSDVDGQMVHLKDIKAGASICVTADIQVMEKQVSDDEGGLYIINSGPYHLRFLDGYYPYHVTLMVNYPVDLIKFDRISPHSQPLFDVIDDNNHLSIDTWFKGILNIHIVFTSSNGM